VQSLHRLGLTAADCCSMRASIQQPSHFGGPAAQPPVRNAQPPAAICVTGALQEAARQQQPGPCLSPLRELLFEGRRRRCPSSTPPFLRAPLPLPRNQPNHIQSSLGRQAESVRPNPGTMAFGTAQRLPRYGKSGVPGPGAYKLPVGLGQQKESKRSSSPRAVFGMCTRGMAEKVYLDMELMKVGGWGFGCGFETTQHRFSSSLEFFLAGAAASACTTDAHCCCTANTPPCARPTTARSPPHLAATTCRVLWGPRSTPQRRARPVSRSARRCARWTTK